MLRHAVGWLLLLLVVCSSLGLRDAPCGAAEGGLLVEGVTAGSPAAKAGVKSGDRLMALDGKPLHSPAALQAIEENGPSKDEGLLRVGRGDEMVLFTVPRGALGIDARPDLPPAALKLYEQARAAKGQEAADGLRASAKEARGTAPEGAAWLYTRAAALYEQLRKDRDALENRLAAWELLEKGPDRAAQSRAAMAVGKARAALGEIPQARQSYEAALRIDQAAGHELWAAGAMNELGDLAAARRELEPARTHYTRSLEIRQRLAPGSYEVAQSLLGLGRVASMREEFPAAQDLIARALPLLEQKAPGSPAVASALASLGEAERANGQLGPAEEHLNRAVELYSRVAPDSLPLSEVLSNLGAVAEARSDHPTARDYYKRSLAIQERLAPESPAVLSTLASLASVTSTLGDLPAAQATYDRALVLAVKQAPGSAMTASILQGLGDLAFTRGELPAAGDFAGRALAIAEKAAPDSLTMAEGLELRGRLSLKRRDAKAAREDLARGLAIRERRAPGTGAVASTLNDLASAARSQGDLPAARDAYRRAQEIHERLAGPGGASVDLAASLMGVGDIAYEQKDYPAAREFAGRALGLYEQLTPGSIQVATVLNHLGNLAVAESRFADAVPLFTRSAAALEAERGRTASGEARALFVEQSSSPYRGIVRAHLGLQDLPAAFTALERVRARSLVEMVREHQTDVMLDAPPELPRQQEELAGRRAAAYAQLARLHPTRDKARVDQARLELDAVLVRQRELDERARQGSPRYAALQHPEPLDFQAAVAAMGEGTVLLSYSVEDDATVLFAVLKLPEARANREPNLPTTVIRSYTLPVPAARLRGQVSEFRQAIAERGAVRQRGKGLYDLLVLPAFRLIERADRILISPDGPLHTLPFGALVTEEAKDGTPRYLADLKPVHHIASMTAYAEVRKAPSSGFGLRPSEARNEPVSPGQPAGPVLAVFGDPDPADPSHLDPLPGKRAEAEEIARIYGKDAVTRLGRAATKAAALEDARRARALHFACLGLLDNRDPLASALALTPSETPNAQGPTPNDGLLRAWEIMNSLRMEADLVVLSGCETGSGKTLKHEGVVGLTRALQYAGARSVVVSLWSAQDESAAALMAAFYRELRKGSPKDVALQQAMAAVRKDSRWRHPFYWAPFSLSGDWR